jgi:hypothetical protein
MQKCCQLPAVKPLLTRRRCVDSGACDTDAGGCDLDSLHNVDTTDGSGARGPRRNTTNLIARSGLGALRSAVTACSGEQRLIEIGLTNNRGRSRLKLELFATRDRDIVEM